MKQLSLFKLSVLSMLVFALSLPKAFAMEEDANGNKTPQKQTSKSEDKKVSENKDSANEEFDESDSDDDKSEEEYLDAPTYTDAELEALKRQTILASLKNKLGQAGQAIQNAGGTVKSKAAEVKKAYDNSPKAQKAVKAALITAAVAGTACAADKTLQKFAPDYAPSNYLFKKRRKLALIKDAEESCKISDREENELGAEKMLALALSNSANAQSFVVEGKTRAHADKLVDNRPSKTQPAALNFDALREDFEELKNSSDENVSWKTFYHLVTSSISSSQISSKYSKLIQLGEENPEIFETAEVDAQTVDLIFGFRGILDDTQNEILSFAIKKYSEEKAAAVAKASDYAKASSDKSSDKSPDKSKDKGKEKDTTPAQNNGRSNGNASAPQNKKVAQTPTSRPVVQNRAATQEMDDATVGFLLKGCKDWTEAITLIEKSFDSEQKRVGASLIQRAIKEEKPSLLLEHARSLNLREVQTKCLNSAIEMFDAKYAADQYAKQLSNNG